MSTAHGWDENNGLLELVMLEEIILYLKMVLENTVQNKFFLYTLHSKYSVQNKLFLFTVQIFFFQLSFIR